MEKVVVFGQSVVLRQLKVVTFGQDGSICTKWLYLCEMAIFG